MSVTIDAVMTEISNHFARSAEDNTYQIVTDGIVGTFSETYIVGQYLWITQSFLNDGVYKITGVTDSKLTLDGTLQEENTGEDIVIYGLCPSAAFLTLATEISTYDDNVGSNRGIKSESQGNRSVTYGSGDTSGDNTWQSAYKNELDSYRRMFDFDTVFYPDYNINTKGCY